MHDIRPAGVAPEPRHVEGQARELQRPARPAAGAAREQLHGAVVLAPGGRLAVERPAGEQLHLRPRASERGRERMVVRRRYRRQIGEADPHQA